MTTHAVEAAAVALHQRIWTPIPEELALASEFFARRERLEQRLLPGMPACRNPQGWVTQHVLWLEDAARVADELLALWRDYLPGSHMMVLLQAYADHARRVVPLAQQLSQAWATERPGACSHQETVWWEDWHLPAEQRRQLDELTHSTIVIGSVMVSALSQAGYAP